jgi:hypothetical protein
MTDLRGVSRSAAAMASDSWRSQRPRQRARCGLVGANDSNRSLLRVARSLLRVALVLGAAPIGCGDDAPTGYAGDSSREAGADAQDDRHPLLDGSALDGNALDGRPQDDQRRAFDDGSSEGLADAGQRDEADTVPADDDAIVEGGRVATPDAGTLVDAGDVDARKVDVDVIDAELDAAQVRFRLRGVLSGLPSGATLELINNASDVVELATNGAFTFAQALIPSASYQVVIGAHTPGLVCTLANDQGTIDRADNDALRVSCVLHSSTVGGALFGLEPGTSVTLQNNESDDLVLARDGRFVFAHPVNQGLAYAVRVVAQPTAQSCSVTNPSGVADRDDVTNVAVQCVARQSHIAGSLSGLRAGETLHLSNGADELVLDQDGLFAFGEGVREGLRYDVQVSLGPQGQSCVVTHGSGLASSVDVNDVTVDCRDDVYRVGGTLSGLASGATLVLLNNGSDPLVLTNNGAFVFALPMVGGVGYAVTMAIQPDNQTCAISAGEASRTSHDVEDVIVTCL